MSATLQGLVREKTGSRAARRLRAHGRIPVSLQGEGKDNLEFSISEDELLTARRRHEHLFDFQLDSGESETAMVRELQWDPFGERILHIEFRRVVLGRKTEVEVALEFIGHPKGGILNHLVTHVAVSCLPTQIPDSIEVRVDALELGDQILAGDLPTPEGAEILLPAETTIAVVTAVRADTDETDAEPTEGEGEGEGEAAAAPEGEAGESSPATES